MSDSYNNIEVDIMNINRKMLRKLILKEINLLNEQSDPQDPREFYSILRRSLIDMGYATMNPVRFIMTYANHKSAIDNAYDEGGVQSAAKKWAEFHTQLIRDVGQPTIDALDALSEME
jgi:hypothetical protein